MARQGQRRDKGATLSQGSTFLRAASPLQSLLTVTTAVLLSHSLDRDQDSVGRGSRAETP